MPKRMLANFAEAQQDTQLLELRDNIAALEARELDLMEQVATGNSEELWRRLRVEYESVHRLLYETQESDDPDVNRHNIESLSQSMQKIDGLTTAGNNDWLTWREIDRVSELKRKFADSERRHLLQMEALYTSQEMMTIAQRMIEVGQSSISDEEDRQAFINGVYEIIEG